MDKVNGLLYAESSSIILCLPARDSVMCSEMHQQDILTTFKTSDDVRHVEDWCENWDSSQLTFFQSIENNTERAVHLKLIEYWFLITW